MRENFLSGLLIATFFFIFNIASGQQCNNWLKFSNQPSFVRIGDLDVPGDKITIEAMFNRTSPWVGVDLYQGDLVSKHLGPENCNYLLRPGSAEITTTKGYFKTPAICPIELNKTYHVAMVYDGKSLKFYRNGFLMSQIKAEGDLFQNDFQTQFGYYTGNIENENMIGYINEVRIWNVVRTQDQIKSYINQSLPNPQTTPGLLAYYTFNNLSNKQGNSTWNGSLSGNTAFAQTNPDCSFVADSCGKKSCENSLKTDFLHERDICSPRTVRFFTKLDNIKSYQWDFGNGSIITGQPNPSITYSTFNSYKIKLKVESNDGCFDSTEKTIGIQIANADLIKTADTAICIGDSFKIRNSRDIVTFCWQATNNQVVPVQLDPLLKPSTSSLYTITAQTLGANLVKNADFSEGNSGFSSDYSNSANGNQPSVYAISLGTVGWGTGLSACTDHTGSNGNMMMVNGSNVENMVVWRQTINVKPNTDYIFITWLQSLSTLNPAKLQFSVNGVPIGNNLVAKTQTCVWDKFFRTWNSGQNTSVTISLINISQDASGNDFALDDMFFGEIFMESDVVNITINQRPEISLVKENTICAGTNIQLNVSGGVQYQWTPSSFLSSDKIANPLASPPSDIKYKIEVRGSNGCTKVDSMFVFVKQEPSFSVSPIDTAICIGDTVRLFASGGDYYSWQPSENVLSPNSANTLIVPQTGMSYKVLIEDRMCHFKDSLIATVNVNSNPVLKLEKSNDIDCNQGKAQLMAKGASRYLWSAASSLSNVNVSNPIVSPRQTSTYYVKGISNDGCSSVDSIMVNVFIDENKMFYLPSAFTPNGDKLNDCFGAKYWGSVTEFSMKIYNRWGQIVFATEKYEDCWNGKYKGVDQPLGIYIYSISAKTLCGKVAKKGTVSLIR